MEHFSEIQNNIPSEKTAQPHKAAYRLVLILTQTVQI